MEKRTKDWELGTCAFELTWVPRPGNWASCRERQPESFVFAHGRERWCWVNADSSRTSLWISCPSVTSYHKTWQPHPTSHSCHGAGIWPQPSRVLWPSVPLQAAVMGRLAWERTRFHAYSQGCWQDSFPCVPSPISSTRTSPGAASCTVAGFIRMNKWEVRESEPEMWKLVSCNLILEAISHHLAIFCLLEASHQVQPSFRVRGWPENVNTWGQGSYKLPARHCLQNLARSRTGWCPSNFQSDWHSLYASSENSCYSTPSVPFIASLAWWVCSTVSRFQFAFLFSLVGIVNLFIG